MAVIDTLPAFEAMIGSGTSPYPEDTDGHPNQAGHDAIAKAVAERLAGDGFAVKR